MEKARITYRMDLSDRQHKEMKPAGDALKIVPLYEEEYQVVEEMPNLNSYTSDFGTWSSPFDAETNRIEQLIRESNDRTIQSNTRVQQQVTQEKQEYDGATGYFPTLYQKSGPSWMKLSTTVAGAVITGVLLGYFVISMFTDTKLSDIQSLDNLKETVSEVMDKSNTISPSALPVSGTTSTLVAASISVNIPARTYTFLQHGSFSTLQSAQTKESELISKGQAVATESSDKFFVYVGMTVTRAQADTLKQQLIAKKIDIYIKPVVVPAATKVQWINKQDVLAPYLKQSDKLIQMMSDLSLIHLEEIKLTPIDDMTLQSLKTDHQTWTQMLATVNEGAPEQVKPTLLKMNNAMHAAKVSLDDYKKSPTTAKLWQTQTNLMKFILTEKELIEEIAVQ